MSQFAGTLAPAEFFSGKGQRAFAQHLDKKESDPDGNGRVGDVEGRPMELIPAEVDKIDHFAHADPVNQVSYGPSQDQRRLRMRGFCWGRRVLNR